MGSGGSVHWERGRLFRSKRGAIWLILQAPTCRGNVWYYPVKGDLSDKARVEFGSRACRPLAKLWDQVAADVTDQYPQATPLHDGAKPYGWDWWAQQ